jgi:hypothetical protein
MRRRLCTLCGMTKRSSEPCKLGTNALALSVLVATITSMAGCATEQSRSGWMAAHPIPVTQPTSVATVKPWVNDRGQGRTAIRPPCADCVAPTFKTLAATDPAVWELPATSVNADQILSPLVLTRAAVDLPALAAAPLEQTLTSSKKIKQLLLTV